VRVLAWVVLALSLVLAYDATTKGAGEHMDFDLYYFGGEVERSSTYTDTPAVMGLAGEAGRLVSGDGVFGSPTLVGLVFQPLSHLSLDTAFLVFQLTAIATLAFAVWRAAGDQWWPVWLAIAVLSTSNIVAFTLGNFSIFTTALVILAYACFRDGKDRQGALVLAIAIACKLYPAFLVLPLLVKRRKEAVAWTVGATATLLAITPFTLGWSDSGAALRQAADVASYVHPWSDNDGLPGSMLRATDSQTLAEWTTRLCMIAATFVVWRYRRLDMSVLFPLAAMVMTLAQGISWNMYYGITLLPLLALRSLDASRLTWVYMAVGYFMANGILLHPTYHLFGLPRGVPLTIGLVIMTATLLAAIHQQAGRLHTEKTSAPTPAAG
jgi:hypothetical protein